MMTERQKTGNYRQEMGRALKGDDIAGMLLDIAVAGIRAADGLPRTPAGRHVAAQLLRSVTSCGANYEEARAAESRRDFVHKLAIALKEANETRYWLKVAFASRLLQSDGVTLIVCQLDDVCRILGKSVGTARRGLDSAPPDPFSSR